LNRARRRAGLRPLVWHAGLARIAMLHSLELCRSGSVRHHSARTGTAADRVRQAHILAKWVGENVGRAASVQALHQSLLQSPAHRANLLRAGLTHVGIGVCVVESSTAANRQIYATQLFIAR
jgi:uncharacterized protein YkwD